MTPVQKFWRPLDTWQYRTITCALLYTLPKYLEFNKFIQLLWVIKALQWSRCEKNKAWIHFFVSGRWENAVLMRQLMCCQPSIWIHHISESFLTLQTGLKLFRISGSGFFFPKEGTNTLECIWKNILQYQGQHQRCGSHTPSKSLSEWIQTQRT